MPWCLTKNQEAKFREALVSKKINPFKLIDMSSEQRRTLFENFVDPENALKINALYESKLLSKNQVTGFKNWAKRALGMTPKVKRDIISKIERLQDIGVLDPENLESFKEDLARSRLGVGITFEEAKNINQMAQETSESRGDWEQKLRDNPDWENAPQSTKKEWVNDSKRLKYGLKQVALENYIKEIKLEAKNRRVKFTEDPVNALLDPIKEAPVFLNNLGKSLMASIDNSFFGRQGIKNLYGSLEQKRIWTQNLVKSFKDIGTELRAKKIDGFESMDFVRADIYSRPNSLNGKFKAGNYQLGVTNEEIFPTSIPEKIPGLGRLFRASETAFSGGALRMRADLADMFISMMDKQGLNTLDPAEARGAGHLVGSLTGRGSVNMTAETQKGVNFVFWSYRFFRANIDTLTAHKFDPQATPFTKTQARKNLVSIVAHLGTIFMLAKFLDPDSVDEDPRSTNFGRLKIFGKWIDITGGMGSLVRLAARLMPSIHNGKVGVWKKSSTGRWTNLIAGEYGQQDAFDLFIDGVFSNKLAPVASIIRDYYRGEMFGGEPFNIEKSITNSVTPLSLQAIGDVKDEKFEVIFATTISEFLGLSVSTYKYGSNWESSTSEEMKQFKEKVGEEKFKEANNNYNRAYNIWFDEVRKTQEYKELSDGSKEKLKSSSRDALKKKIFKEYGFRKPRTVKTLEERKEELVRKRLEP